MRPPAETATPVDPSLRPAEGDFVLKSFHFESGDTLPELRIHYLTLGTPVRDATGVRFTIRTEHSRTELPGRSV